MLVSLSALLILAVPNIQAAAKGPLLREEFEAVPAWDGDPPPGLASRGWSQAGTLDAMILPVSMAGESRGAISFDLMRLPEPGKNIPDTVFEFLDKDGNRIWRLQVQWESPHGPTAFLIKSAPARDYFHYGAGLWSPVIYLDRVVDPGQWVRMELFWDDEERRYGAFADRQPLNATSGPIQIPPDDTPVPDRRPGENRSRERPVEPLLFPEKPFAYFLDRVAAVALGNNPVSEMPPGRHRTLLVHSVLDNFEIRTGNLASIRSISHDAFTRAGYSGRLVTGETVKVTMMAGPGGKGTFHIQDELSGRAFVSGVPMVEDDQLPGTYVGEYTVRPGDHVEMGKVEGHFINYAGFGAVPLTGSRSLSVDGRVHFEVTTSNDLLPADESSRSGLTVVAKDANGRAVQGHELKLTMSTTDEYTGTVGGGTFEDLVGGEVDVDWGGITDSFGEVTAQYVSGFAAKTILFSARDMVTGDVGVGWLRSYIEGEVDIVVTEPLARALSVVGSLEISLSRQWLTADGRSRSRVTAVVKDAEGKPASGHNVKFTLLGDNGSIRVVQGRTDSRGRALADYIAGTVMGQVQVEVRDLTSGMTAIVSIELRPDAPAEITLAAQPAEIVTGGESTVTAKVTDANGNPNRGVDVLYDVSAGEGVLSAPKVATDDKGLASVQFTADGRPGLVRVRGTVVSREPTAEEISAARGAVFLYGLEEDPGRLEVVEWLVKPGDEVVKGQELVILGDRRNNTYAAVAPRDGVVSTFVAEERDRVQYGDTLGYVVEAAE